MSKINRKSFGPPKPRVHESSEDRARTLSGKTASSKVRNEGRARAALEKRAAVHRGFDAEEARRRGSGLA